MESNDVELVSLVEWAREKEISQQWACKLCADRRMPGAVFVDNYRWMVPKGSVSPTRKKSARLVEIHTNRERRQHEEDMRDLAILEQEEKDRKAWAEQCARIEAHVRAGRCIDAKGHVWDVVNRKPVFPIVEKFDEWEQREQTHYFNVGGKKNPADISAPVVGPVDVPNAPVSSEWPDTDAEWENQENIREGVHGGLTLDAIKAQCDGWGNSEQAFYQSLVSGTDNA